MPIMLTAQKINLKTPAIRQKFMYLESLREGLIKSGLIIIATGAKETKPITRIENEASILEYILLSNTQYFINNEVDAYRKQYV